MNLSYRIEDPLFMAMSFKDVLEETGRSPRTVNRWIEQGRLPSYRLDGERIFVRRDVLRVEVASARRKGRPGARLKARYLREHPFGERTDSTGNRQNPLSFGGGT